MSLKEFIENVLKEYEMEYKPEDVEKYIISKARDMAVKNVAAVDDETVKDWIVNYDPVQKHSPEAQKIIDNKKEKSAQAVKPVIQKKLKPIKIEEKKEEKKQNEQLSLFDIL